MELSQAPVAREVQCPQCRQVLPRDFSGIDAYRKCPACKSELLVWRFPALGRSKEELIGRGTVALPGEAACFFHPEKKASLGCERCGRFICTLCDMPIGSRHLCPSCVGSGLESEKVPELVSRRFVWPSFALAMGWLPLLLIFFLMPIFVLTGPAAVFAGLWGWNKPGSVVQGRRRGAAILGILGGGLQLLIIASFVLAIWTAREARTGEVRVPIQNLVTRSNGEEIRRG